MPQKVIRRMRSSPADGVPQPSVLSVSTQSDLSDSRRTHEVSPRASMSTNWSIRRALVSTLLALLSRNSRGLGLDDFAGRGAMERFLDSAYRRASNLL